MDKRTGVRQTRKERDEKAVPMDEVMGNDLDGMSHLMAANVKAYQAFTQAPFYAELVKILLKKQNEAATSLLLDMSHDDSNVARGRARGLHSALTILSNMLKLLK
jgi:hypothetical protein